jgi:hypothetical protein
MNVSENICPVCKTKNELEAVVCVHCGATLGDSFVESAYETKTTDMQALTPELIKDWSFKDVMAPEVPDNGIAVYVEGEAKPAYIDSKEEFVLGRKAGKTEGMIVDLAPFRAYSLGLSRRHVTIRRVGDGYEVMDLGSVNGTWLNEERLASHTSYPLPSGSRLRLGQMRIFVLYRPFAKTE